jgi:hypothetical protein
MYDLPHTGGGNIPGPELKSMLAERQATTRGLPLGQVPALRPCNLLVVLTDYHIVNLSGVTGKARSGI